MRLISLSVYYINLDNLKAFMPDLPNSEGFNVDDSIQVNANWIISSYLIIATPTNPCFPSPPGQETSGLPGGDNQRGSPRHPEAHGQLDRQQRPQVHHPRPGEGNPQQVHQRPGTPCSQAVNATTTLRLEYYNPSITIARI